MAYHPAGKNQPPGASTPEEEMLPQIPEGETLPALSAFPVMPP